MPKETKEPPAIVANTFESVLRNQRKGNMAAELSEKLQQLTKAVMSIGKPGKITLVLSVDPNSGDGSCVSVEDKIELKLPQATKPKSIFYTTEEGQLVRDNPEQKTLDLKVVGETDPDKLANASCGITQANA